MYANRRDPIRKAGRWVTPAVKRITVAPRSEVSVAFTVRVPGRAKPGDHVAGIAFEDAHHRTGGGAFRVIEIFREVLGIQIQVPGRAFPRLTVGQVRLAALPGTRVASAVVPLGNRGLKLCKPKLTVGLRGPHRYSRLVIKALDTVLPGDRVDYPLPWPGRLSGGSYRASASATCKGARAATVSTALLGKALGTVLTAPTAAAKSRPAVPAWVLILVALAGLGAGVFFTYVHMARRHRAALAAAAEQARAQLPIAPSAGHPPTAV